MVLVLVTVDGGGRGWEALEWAAAEADARGARLRVRHASGLSLKCDPYVSTFIDSAGMQDRAEVILREAVARSRAIAPELEVSGELWADADAPLADDLEDHEEVLIVVPRERPSLLLRLKPCAASRVASRTRHPVAVAGLFPKAEGPSAGRVVVAVAGGDPDPAVLFALGSARRRGVGLTAVEAISHVPGAPRDGWSHLNQPSACLCASLLAAAQLFPGVDIRWSCTGGVREAGLIEESPGAALIVLGIHHRRAWRLAVLGSLEATVLRSMRAPVVLVGSSA